MPHDTPLIATIVGALVLAFVFGAIAQRLKLSPLVGYLLAGILVGPHTPGFVADQQMAPQLAEIGVILLMFGVGLHFSLKDLLSVKTIAIPGALAQIGVATLLGLGLSALMGWSLAAGMVFGLSLSVASTVVLLRALQEQGIVNTERGKIAVGWLIVEDLAMVLALVLLPAFLELDTDKLTTSNLQPILLTLGATLGKVAAFIALMLLIGRRVIPWILHEIAHSGSRELFRLGVLAIALGVAYGAATLFGVSFALGAFFAGMVMSESELSHQAAAESLPLRDAFAVLFFVSVGMLFNPTVLLTDPWPIIGTVLIIVIGKSLAALCIVLAFRHPWRTALTISVSLAQIGEFSFILAGLGVYLGVLPPQGQVLILAGAILSIMLNPLLFTALDHLQPWLNQRDGITEPAPPKPENEDLVTVTLRGHAVLVGYGRVGRLVGEALAEHGVPLAVIDNDRQLVDQLRGAGVPALLGHAAADRVLTAANIGQARWLILAIPDGFEGGQVAAKAKAANPGLQIIARAHSDAQVDHLKKFGADFTIMGEREIAASMIGHLWPRAAETPEPAG